MIAGLIWGRNRLFWAVTLNSYRLPGHFVDLHVQWIAGSESVHRSELAEIQRVGQA